MVGRSQRRQSVVAVPAVGAAAVVGATVVVGAIVVVVDGGTAVVGAGDTGKAGCADSA